MGCSFDFVFHQLDIEFAVFDEYNMYPLDEKISDLQKPIKFVSKIVKVVMMEKRIKKIIV